LTLNPVEFHCILDSRGFEPAKHITTFTDSMSFHELQIARALPHFAKTVDTY
jgi:hypothetical protein